VIPILVALTLALATLGDGGMSPFSLLAQHLAVLAAILIALFRTPSAFGPDRAPARAWLAFAALAALGALGAPYAYGAWLVLVDLTVCGALAWLVAREPGPMRVALPATIGALAAMHGIAAVVQKLGGTSRPASTFLNPNHLAAWLCAAVLLLAGVVADRLARRAARGLGSASIAIALAGVFVTGSRGAVVGLAAGGIALAATSWITLSAAVRRRMLLGVAAGVAVASIGVALRFETDSDPYRFHRTRIWRASLGALARSPLRGTGPGQFVSAAPNLNFPLEDTPLRFGRVFHSPHSDALRAFCEFGTPAGIVAFAGAFLFATSFWRRRPEASGIERGAFAAVVALGSQGLIDDLSSRPAITVAAAALAGLAVARPRPSVAPPRRIVIASAALLATLALGAGEVAGFLGWYNGQRLPPGRLDPAGLARLGRAISWNLIQPDLWRRLALHEMGDARSWTVDGYARAREASERARRLQPADATFARGAARVEAEACHTLFPFETTRARAEALYGEAEALARTDATIPLEAAIFAFQAGDASGARRAAERALRIEPNGSVPRIWLARALLEEEGKPAVERARKLLDEAASVALPAGTAPSSPYEATLRAVDSELLAAARRTLDAVAAR